jgi:hypothetical protein
MSLLADLEALLKQLEPEVAKAFRAAIQDVTDNAILQQVIDAIERNDVDAAFRALGFSQASFNGFVASLQSVFQAGGAATMATFPKYVTGADGIKTMLRFNVRDPQAEKWLQEQSSRLIVEIEDDVRRAVRDTMTVGLEQGRNPRKTALDIIGRINRQTGHREGGVVGLGSREQYWARSAREKLLTLDKGYFELSLRDARFDATVAAAIDSGKPLSVETVDKLVDRYRANALRHRGEMIARTETLHGLNRSEWLSIKQAVDQGNLDENAVTRIWDSAGDNRVRPSHRALDGQRVKLDEPFVTATGARMMHPGDTTLGAPGKEVIGCRCRVRIDVDWFAGAK